MADGVPITAGSGTTIATDDCGASGHAQVTKLAIATDGSATLIPANATDGLSVKVTNALSVAPTVVSSQSQNSSGLTTATTAYSAGDVLGAGWTFTSMGTNGRIVGVSLEDKANIMVSADLFLSSGAITFGTDNAAPSVSDADGEKILQSISVVMTDIGVTSVATAGNLLVPYVCDATSLYVYAMTRTSHTFFGAATDLRLKLLYEVGG